MNNYISTKENPNGDIMPEDVGMYTNLHAHSVYSPLDGYGKLNEYCQRAVALGFKGLCLSEHGTMMGHLEQAKVCKKHGIKPIFSNEGYFTLQSGTQKEKVEGYKSSYHILLIAKNNTGYKNLMKATSIAWTKYKYYKPRFDLELLEECSEGIICLTACLGGALSQLFLDGRTEEAEEVAIRLKNIFKDNLYLELTYTGLEEQDRANKFLKELSVKHDIKLVITCDSHYVYPWQSDSHMKLVLINTGGQLQKESKEVDLVNNEKENADVDSSSMFYQPNQYYVKPYHVMRNEYYSDEMDRVAFENTNKIAEECNVDISHDDRMIFPMPYSDPHSVLENKVMAWHNQYTKDFSEEDKKIYKDRLIEELTIYDKMDFSSYPLVLEEIINHANSKGILTGPGRGCSEKHLRVIVIRDGLYKYINIDQVKVGDFVIGHSGRIREVKNVFEYHIEEDMIEIETFFSDRLSRNILTRDHKILIHNKEWVESSNVVAGDFVKLPILDPIGEKIESFDLLDFCNKDKVIEFTNEYIVYSIVPNTPVKFSEAFISESGISKSVYKSICSDLHYNGQLRKSYERFIPKIEQIYGSVESFAKAIKSNREVKFKRHLVVDENFVYSVGQFVGDGYISSDNRIGMYIYYNLSQTDRSSKFISFLKSMDITPLESIRENTLLCYGLNEPLTNLLRFLFSDYKYSSNTKYIPKFIFGLDKDLINTFLMGYLSSDGYYDDSKKSYKATSTSLNLIDGIKQICSILGYACSIYEEKREYNSIKLSEGNRVFNANIKMPENFDKRYCFIDGNYLCMRVKSVIEIDKYSTSVYDFEVDEDHSYTTSSYIQHNSAAGSLISYALGLTKIDPIPYGLMFSRYLSAGRAKYPLIEFDGYPLSEWNKKNE